MKIVYDATPLLMRSAGVKNYHHALLENLLRLAPAEDVEIELFPYLDGLAPNENESSNYPPSATKFRLAGILASNYLGYPYAASAVKGASLFHISQNLLRPPGGPRLTSMVHDTTPLNLPSCHTPSNIRYFERFVRDVLPRLDGIITPTETVKHELVNELSVPAEKVRSIPHGVDPDFYEVSQAQFQVAQETYGLPANYVLFIGSMEPRKNLERLAQAYDLLPGKMQAEYPLVIAGTSGWKNEKIRARLGKNKNVRMIGYVKRELLPAVYASSSAFVFPSLYEGFGMPVVEAMASGAPVICSSAGALPEVVGNGAMLVDPRDVDGWAQAMMKVLSDPHRATVMGDTGRSRARSYSWSRCAAETLEYLRGVAG